MRLSRRITSLGALTALLALIPPLILAGLVAHYVVDVPYFDQWNFSQLTTYYRNGGRDPGQLFAQHHEARMLFPSMLNLACEYLSGGDLRLCAVAALLLAALSLWNIRRLAALSLPHSPIGRMAITVIASMMIFSPVQWQNWLWSNQLALFFPAACLTSAISVALSGVRFTLKLVVCALLAFVATFSFPNGILCWVVLPALLVGQPGTGKGRAQAAAVWLIAATGSLWLFFLGYQVPATHAGWQESLAQPKLLVLSLLGFLGAPLASGDEFWVYRSASLVSVALLSLLAAACLAVWMGRQRVLLSRGAGWLALCAFALCTAAVTALGRSTMSSVFLHDSRYTSFSIYLVIGLAGLVAVILAEWPGQRRRAILTAAGALLVIVVGLHVSASAQSLQAMRAWREERLQSKACLALINAVDSPCTLTKLGPARGWVLEVSAALNKLGLLHPALLLTARLPERLIAAAPLDPAYGNFVSLRHLPDGSWIASGFAVLPGRDEPADGVVITYDDAQGAHHVAGLATTPTQGPDSELKSRWVKWFVLPETAEVVRAYAYDAPAGRFLPLAPAHRVSGAEVSLIRFGTEGSGALDRLGRGFIHITDPSEPMMAIGWSFLRAQNRVPDAIVVTCDGHQTIVGSGEAHMERPDVVRALGNNPQSFRSGFGALIDEKRLPAGGCPLRAWAYDSASHTAQPIEPSKDSAQVPAR